MISCYIIGDGYTIESLKVHIEKSPLTRLMGYSSNFVNSMEALLVDTPKILFIDSAYITPFKALLIKIGKRNNIIYIANTTAYAYEAFETFALDYLMKPLTFELFERSIDKFINFSQSAPLITTNESLLTYKTESITDSFFIRSDVKGMKEVLIKCREVIFIEAEQNYVIVHTEHNKYLSHNTLKEMEENLPDRFFIRVHKSFIINYEKITSVEGNVLFLNEKYKIQIGLTYKKAFFERKNLKIIKKKNYINGVKLSNLLAKAILIFNLLENVYDFI